MEMQKFLFDRSFDTSRVIETNNKPEAEPTFEPEIPVPSYTEQDLNLAREEGIEKGREEAMNIAKEETEAKLQATLETLLSKISSILENQAVETHKLSGSMIRIAVALLEKCFPKLSEGYGIGEIENMLKQVLPDLLEEPMITLKVHADLKEALESRCKEITKTAKFNGQFLIEDAEHVGMGDCEIIWNNGAAKRSFSEIWQQVEEILNSTFPAHAIDTVSSTEAASQNELSKISENTLRGDLDDKTTLMNTSSGPVASPENSHSQANQENGHQNQGSIPENDANHSGVDQSSSKPIKEDDIELKPDSAIGETELTVPSVLQEEEVKNVLEPHTNATLELNQQEVKDSESVEIIKNDN